VLIWFTCGFFSFLNTVTKRSIMIYCIMYYIYTISTIPSFLIVDLHCLEHGILLSQTYFRLFECVLCLGQFCIGHRVFGLVNHFLRNILADFATLLFLFYIV